MTLPRNKNKVKRKKRILRKKRQIYSQAKKRQRKKKRAKKELVLNTNRRIKQLQKQVAALKKKVKAQKAARRRSKPEPGALLSERSEAAKRGWTTRRANEAKKAAQESRPEQQKIRVGEMPAGDMTQAEFGELLKITKGAVANRKNILDTFVKKLPDYLVRGDEMLVEQIDNKIMFDLIIADQITGGFDERAYALAEEYDLEPWEVYSLWHGYSLSED